MPEVGLSFKPAATLAVGASKLGGLPSVPRGFVWPVGPYGNRPLGYVLQINFAELQAAVPTDELPKRGLLQLFCSIEETDLSEPDPGHKILFHADPSALVEAPLPAKIDVVEATLEQRAIAFGSGGEARMLGDLPELDGDLEGVFDPDDDVLLLELDAYDNVTRPGASHSIFGEGRFVLTIKHEALAEGQLDEAQLLFVSGT